MTDLSRDERVAAAREKALGCGLTVRARKRPPWGWELVDATGKVLESGALIDVELAITRAESA